MRRRSRVPVCSSYHSLLLLLFCVALRCEFEGEEKGEERGKLKDKNREGGGVSKFRAQRDAATRRGLFYVSKEASEEVKGGMRGRRSTQQRERGFVPNFSQGLHFHSLSCPASQRRRVHIDQVFLRRGG